MSMMKRLVAVVLGIVLCVVSAGCLELTGQRLTIWYDEESDELSMLIWYDGLHWSDVDFMTSPAERPANRVELGLRDFLGDGTEGGVFLFHGVFLLEHGFFDGDDSKFEDEPPLRRALGERMQRTIDRTILGRYRDPDGRIGVAQHVVVREATALMEGVSRAINEALLMDRDERAEWGERHPLAEKGLLHTGALMDSAAERGHAWVRMEDGRVVVEIPVDARERARVKAMVFEELIRNAVDEEESWMMLVRMLASMPLEMEERRESFVFRFGGEGVVRMRLFMDTEGDAYSGNLEEMVEEIVDADIDEQIARVYAGFAKWREGAELVMDYGHPEDSVRRWLAQEDFTMLEMWGETWNDDGGYPPAPVGGEGDDARRAWVDWYRAILKEPGGPGG